MKIFEGKSPTERNKIIAASVLGLLALVALTYTFGGMFFGKKPTTVSTSPTPKPSVLPNSQTISALPTAEETDFVYSTTPVYYNGTPFAPDAGRNIFAFYEPPPPTPYSPTPVRTPTPFIEVVVTPIPTPTPPFTIFTASPANGAVIYAGQQGFRIEINGDKFTPDSQIIVNNQALPTTFVSSQRLTADIPTEFLRSAGNLMITVATPDGKLYSNAVSLGIQAPPLPQFKYIGVTIRKGNNNNTATILEDPKKESLVRLNDNIGGRFKVVSIAKNEIVVQDVVLGFSYRKAIEMIGQATTSSRGDTQNPNFNGNPTTNPNQPNCIPGIPCNIPLYNPNNSSIDQRQQQKQQQQKDDYDDDDDGDN